MNELLEYFKEKGVAIQITLDIGMNPTVHALYLKDQERLHKTEAKTIESALELMKYKLFGESSDEQTSEWQV